MKQQAILKYDLTDIEAEQAFKRAVASDKMASAIWELKYNFYRGFRRKVEDEGKDSMNAALELINEYTEGIDIDELWR